MSDEMIPAEVRERAAARIAERGIHPESVYMSGPFTTPGERRRCFDAADAVLAVLAEAGCLRTPGTVELDRGRAERLLALANTVDGPAWASMYTWEMLQPGDLDPLP